MSDEVIRLHVDGTDEVHELTPNNSGLFTFWGRVAVQNGDTEDISTRNHVYFVSGEERTGQYIFAPETVQALGAVMLRNHYPADLYKRRVPEGDEEAYQQYLLQNQNETAEDIPDTFPDDWSSDGAA